MYYFTLLIGQDIWDRPYFLPACIYSESTAKTIIYACSVEGNKRKSFWFVNYLAYCKPICRATDIFNRNFSWNKEVKVTYTTMARPWSDVPPVLAE